MCLIVPEAAGAPVFGKQFRLRQPDGTPVETRIWGHEFYCVVESLDGYTLTQDDRSGMICYARISEGSDDLVSTGIPPGQAAGEALRLQRHIRITRDAAEAKVNCGRRRFFPW